MSDKDNGYFFIQMQYQDGTIEFVNKTFWTLEAADEYANKNIPSNIWVDIYQGTLEKSRMP